MNCIKADLPRELKELKIEIFSDLHIGDKHCDFKAIQERIRKVKDNSDTYCIMVGDIIDNPTKTSVGDTYEETLSPMQQIKTAISMFDPIKDKILGGVGGNHEFRTYKTEGIDLGYFMFSEFRIPDRYFRDGALLFLRFGAMSKGMKETSGSGEIRKICYTMYLNHGSSGGRTPGAKANGLQRQGQIVNADICVVGHTHMPMVFKEISNEIDYPNSTTREKETVYVNASSTLGWGGYSERMGMKPSSNASPIIVLNGAKKDIRVTL